MNEKEKEIFSEILKNPKIFNKRGSVSPGIFAKYPEVIKYCEEQVKKYPEFESASNYFSLVSRGKWLPKCIICGKDLSYKSSVLNGKIMHGECRRSPEGLAYVQKNIEKTFMKKYGTKCCWGNPEIRKKCTENRASKTPEEKQAIIEKTKQTCFERYGVNCGLMVRTPESEEKLRRTLKEKYNYDGHPSALYSFLVKTGQREKKLTKLSKATKQKLLNFCKEEDLIMLDEYVNKQTVTKFTRYHFKCNKCGNIFEDYMCSNHHPICRICKPKDFQSSKGENELIQWLSKYINCSIRVKHVISPFELDIFIQEKNVAIEFNGIFWHSEEAGVDKDYHITKTNLCEEKGIHLIQIFEDEWTHKKEVVKAKLKHILGFNKYKIYAEKCEVREIKHEMAAKFIEKYHIQGMTNTQVNLGLFYKNRIVAVMCFSHSKKYKWDMTRYATLFNFSIIEGALKMLSYFRKNYKGSIISYVDRRWSNGEIYKKLGFIEQEPSAPTYWYVKNYNRYNKSIFQKHKLKNLLENFDPNLTEQENMRNNKYKRIWDCGNRVFVLD